MQITNGCFSNTPLLAAGYFIAVEFTRRHRRIQPVYGRITANIQVKGL